MVQKNSGSVSMASCLKMTSESSSNNSMRLLSNTKNKKERTEQRHTEADTPPYRSHDATPIKTPKTINAGTSQAQNLTSQKLGTKTSVTHGCSHPQSKCRTINFSDATARLTTAQNNLDCAHDTTRPPCQSLMETNVSAESC